MIDLKSIGRSVFYFEPLKLKLNDCFGALKDVIPDLVYSNLKGSSGGANSQSDDVSNSTSGDDNGETSTENVPSTSTSKKRKQKRRNPLT